MARSSRPTRSPPAAAADGPSSPRRRPAARGAPGKPAIADDLIDVEAPPQGGSAVDTAAYAVPPEAAGAPAIASDLVDVEAPPLGGEAVDTAAYARGADGGRSRGRPRGGSAAASLIEAQAPPPPSPIPTPPEPGSGGADADPLAGEAGGAPPPAGPELGGGPPAMDEGDLLERASLAALRLAADRPWPEVTLREVAREAGVPFAALYARAAGRRALLLALSVRLDRQALERMEGEDAPSPRDRLFEAFMSRLEVMAPHRDALLAVGRSEGVGLAPALPRTARALAEGAGVDTSGARGALRVAALTGAWARTLQVWRDDEGALNRTMAEIDKLLTQADRRLARVGAGF